MHARTDEKEKESLWPLALSRFGEHMHPEATLWCQIDQWRRGSLDST